MKLLLLCFLLTNFLQAQSSLSGTILDDKNEGLFFSTVALYNAKDSTIAKAESTDDNGFFEIKGIKDGSYYLEATMLSYETGKITSLNFPSDNGKKIKLNLSPDSKTLATVEVTAKLPLLEQKSDRLVVNVENNLTSLNGSLLDVMKKVPGMIVVGDKLRMAGQSNVTILINGKTTRYMDMESLLRDMPGDNIKKVEVIHQPGAEFEAAGSGAIINIILKKNSLFGTNGSISAGIAKGNQWKQNASLSLSHYQGNVNINGSIGYRNSPYLDQLLLSRRVGGDIYDQQNFDPDRSNTFRSSLSVDWDINDRHRIGVSGRYIDNRSDNVAENKTQINFIDTAKSDLRLVTTNQSDDFWRFFNVNPYYSFEFDTTGHKIDFDVNIVKLKNGGISTLLTTEEVIGGFFPGQRYEQPGNTSIFATKLDYTYPFSDALKLQLGGKYSKADLDNNLQSFDETSEGVFVPNVNQSNRFLFDESIKAGYAKLSYAKDKWSGTFGLRYELSESEGKSQALDSTLTRDISKLFPSFSIGREIVKGLGATLAYSYRIDRPRYSSLNPFVYYLDPYTFEEGNPVLAPALTHSAKFTLSYEKQPFFNVEYKHTNDAMIEVTEQNDASGSTNLTTVNLETAKYFNVSLFFPLDFIPGIEGYGGVIAAHTKYDSKYLEQDFLRSRWSYTGFLQVNFELPGKIDTEISGWYNSGGVEGILDSEWLYGVSFGMSKKFLDNKLKVSFGVEDIFNRFYYANVNYANMDFDVISKWDSGIANLKLTYKFGNQHMKRSKRRRGSGAEEINRVQKN